MNPYSSKGGQFHRNGRFCNNGLQSIVLRVYCQAATTLIPVK